MAKAIFLIFGRFQPPTIGHELLFKNALTRARRDNADVAVFVSHTQDRKNPLSYDDKVSVIRRSVPGLIMGPASVRTPAEALTWALDKGYRTITLLVGEDREAGFEKMAGSWQKAEDPKQRALVRVEALPRTGSMDASKVSGTVARRYAQQGDLTNLKKILISGAQQDAVAKRFMKVIQDRLGPLKEMYMGRKRRLTESDEAQVSRVVSTLVNDSSWLRTDDTPYVTIDEPDNDGDIDPNERVPEDTDTNKSVVVIHPRRHLKFDTKVKVQKAEEEAKAKKNI
jgi:nicotinic acid mononucleotide adenylyltransferase